MFKIAMIAASALVATTAVASAHSSSKKFDRIQDRQYDRIEMGRKTGNITWTEGRKLRREQKNISALKRRFENDGRLDKHERAVLRAQQRDAAYNIYDERTDRRRRVWWAPRVGR